MGHHTKIDLTVYDMMGNRVTETIRIKSSNGVQVIDLSNQVDGVYMLRVLLDDAEMIQERLILVK